MNWGGTRASACLWMRRTWRMILYGDVASLWWWYIGEVVNWGSRSRARLCPHIKPAMFLHVYLYDIPVSHKYFVSVQYFTWESNILCFVSLQGAIPVDVEKNGRLEMGTQSGQRYGHLKYSVMNIVMWNCLDDVPPSISSCMWHIGTRICMTSSEPHLLRLFYHTSTT